MNETVVDVLIYLYENYMDGEVQPPADQGELQEELMQAGFHKEEIDKAFRWLDDLAAKAGTPALLNYGKPSIRIYSAQESLKLDADARGFLLFLEQNEILNPLARELVIERAVALETSFITVDELKWIVLLVLMSQPGQENAFARMEDMVFSDPAVYLH